MIDSTDLQRAIGTTLIWFRRNKKCRCSQCPHTVMFELSIGREAGKTGCGSDQVEVDPSEAVRPATKRSLWLLPGCGLGH